MVVAGIYIHNMDTSGQSSAESKNQSGAQSIERAIDVMRRVAEAGVHGVRLTDLVTQPD